MTEFIWRGPDETPLLLNEPIIIWTKNDRIQTSSNTKGQLMGPIVNGNVHINIFQIGIILDINMEQKHGLIKKT